MQATINKIVNYDSLNPQTGVRFSLPVNVNGVYTMNSNISYSMPARFLKGTVEVGGRTSYLRGKQFINSLSNNTGTWILGPELSLDMNPHNKINISVGASLNYNTTRYSLQSVMNNSYLSQEYNASFDWQLPSSFFMATDFSYTINRQKAQGFNTMVPLWNASLSKQFLHYNRGELKFSVTDLLNKNVVISHTSNANYIDDSRTNSLRRFFMLSFTYSLSKTGLNNAGSGVRQMILR
jgi:hypothetical protein